MARHESVRALWEAIYAMGDAVNARELPATCAAGLAVDAALRRCLLAVAEKVKEKARIRVIPAKSVIADDALFSLDTDRIVDSLLTGDGGATKEREA